jgi:isocitrate/isopropylmalate dehydrogenase
LAAGLMLEFLGWNSEAAVLHDAVKSALRENFVTPDLGGDKGTQAVGDWLVQRVAEHQPKTT